MNLTGLDAVRAGEFVQGVDVAVRAGKHQYLPAANGRASSGAVN
jgi:hypothetical protein